MANSGRRRHHKELIQNQNPPEPKGILKAKSPQVLPRRSILSHIFDHPKSALFLAFIVFAVTFSPKVTIVGTWVCLLIAYAIYAVGVPGLPMLNTRNKMAFAWVGMFVGLLIFGRWLTSGKEQSASFVPSDAPLSSINMTMDLDYRIPMEWWFWFVYNCSAYGQAASPVAVAKYVELTNTSSTPQTIQSFAVAINTSQCG